MFSYSFILVLLTLSIVHSIPVDNNVEGEPEIECGPTSITVNFNTRNPFQGHVFVKGLYDMDNCRNDEGGRQVAGIELAFDTCNVARTRSLNPKGIFVSTTVIISFHPQFVTKVDGAYRIECFYMESDKTVSADIEVSDLTTHFQTALVPMPVCKYEILAGGPTGEPVQFASVGQQVYHKWTCESETTDTFCAVVHSCTVDDGNGDRIMILNEDGCALDKFILNNLEYPQDLMAGQEAHVYKYADRNQLFYQCQISISVKEPKSECARPQCPEAKNFGAKKVGEDAGVEHSSSVAYNPSSTQHEVTASTVPYSPTTSSSPSSSASASSSSSGSSGSSSSSRRISIFARHPASSTESTVTVAPAAESDGAPHAGSSAIFAEPAAIETDEDVRRDHILRLLRRKRSTNGEKDGVRVLSLEDEKSWPSIKTSMGDGNHSIRKRIKRDSLIWDGHTVDVRTELTALDFTDAELALSDLLRARRAARHASSALVSFSPSSSEVCLSISALSALGALSLIIFSSFILILSLLFRSRGKIIDNDC